MLCPTCTQEISDTAKFCRHCRTDLRQILPADPAPFALSVEATSIPCPVCATPIANSARFCKHCGERFEISAAAPDAFPPQEAHSSLATEPLATHTPSAPRLAEVPHSKPPVETPSPQSGLASDHAPENTPPPPVAPENKLEVFITAEASTNTPKKANITVIVGGAVLALALGGGGWWWSQQERMPASPAMPESIPSTPTPVAAETLPAVAPSTGAAATHNAATETLPADTEQAAGKKAAEPKTEDARKAKKTEETRTAAKQAAREQAAFEKIAADARARQAAQAAKAPAPQQSASGDWQSALRANLDACANQPFLLRLPCNEKARWKYCPGNWGKSEECKVSSNNQGSGN